MLCKQTPAERGIFLRTLQCNLDSVQKKAKEDVYDTSMTMPHVWCVFRVLLVYIFKIWDEERYIEGQYLSQLFFVE